MSTDVTYAMRISQETKDLLQKLQSESGETQAEFFKRVALNIELEQLKEDGMAKEEIEELQMHTARINEIMIALVERGNSFKAMNDQQMQEIKTELTEKINNQAKKLEELTTEKERIDSDNRELRNRCSELDTQLSDTKISLGQANDLITEYKNKINYLSVLAAENQRKANEYDAMLLKVQELETRAEAAENARCEAEKTAQTLKTEVKNQVGEMKEQLTNANVALEEAKLLVKEFKTKFEQSENNMKTALREAAAQTREEVANVREEYLGRMETYQIKQNEYIQTIQSLRIELAQKRSEPLKEDLNEHS